MQKPNAILRCEEHISSLRGYTFHHMDQLRYNSSSTRNSLGLHLLYLSNIIHTQVVLPAGEAQVYYVANAGQGRQTIVGPVGRLTIIGITWESPKDLELLESLIPLMLPRLRLI
jgi:hypothetical protein